MANVLDSTGQYLLASLRTLARRHAVLAGNLANAHTPGYARVDVDFGATLRALYEEGPEGPPASGVAFLRSDGTGPDPELEAAEMSRTALVSMALTNLLAAKLDMLRAAILEGRR
ncbi:MAG: hypothetical protein RMM30_05195 [Armatimonadota bacterium]|nr:hypothetical protein [Armatimonadota bacterium]MDW8155963.1 hypothetical protein [Armatimonadota bacterium]